MAMKRAKLSIRGQRRNGLPVRTLMTVVVALNMARRAGGCYVEDGIKRLARDMADPQWGGSQWCLLPFRLPKLCRPMVPTGAELS